MTASRKLTVASLVLSVGIGFAFLFQKTGDRIVPSQTSDASTIVLPSALLKFGQLALQPSVDGEVEPKQKTAPVVQSGLFTSSNMKRSVSDTTQGNQTTKSVSQQSRVHQQERTSKKLSHVLPTNAQMKKPPTLPNHFPAQAKAGHSLRPAYPTVVNRERTAEENREGVEELPDIHKVADGDTLESIAKMYFKDTAKAGMLYLLNREKIDDPNMLPIGLKLQLRMPVKPPS